MFKIFGFQRTNPKLSIRPPLSITGVECPPLPISYTQEKGGYIPPLLRSAPLRSAAKGTSLRYAAFCTPLRSTRSAPLQKALRFATLPFALRSAPLAPLRSARSPRKALLAAPLRFALLYITGDNYVQNCE